MVTLIPIKAATGYLNGYSDADLRSELERDRKQFILHSNNTDYSNFKIGLNQVLEVWKALGYVCFELPNVNNQD